MNTYLSNCRLILIKLSHKLNPLKISPFLNKKTQTDIRIFRVFIPLVLSALITANFGCGKRRPPLPPTNARQTNQTNFTATQQGSRIALTIPLKSDNGGSRPRQIDVFRLAESIGSPLFLTEDEFASRSTQVGSIQLTGVESGEVSFFDALTPTNQPRRLRYAVRFVNAENQKSPFSNFIFFEPISNAAKSPILAVPVVTQTAINLSWQPPQENVDASVPVNVLGYNLYRKSNRIEKPQQINNSLLSQTQFDDKNFKFGDEYEYFVRTISAGSNGAQIESVDSNSVTIAPKDVFPPAAPEGLTIAAAPGNLSIFFAASAEPDVIGYNIFRTTEPELPPEQWQKLNDALITAASFQDTKVESGQKYFYFVAAIDSAGNVSQPSETISETAP
jgi:hypothetical protein